MVQIFQIKSLKILTKTDVQFYELVDTLIIRAFLRKL